MKSILNESYVPLPSCAGEWWEKVAVLFKLKRQGLDLICASFEHKDKDDRKPIANVVLITGWSESFLKYGLIIEALYERGFNVYTYDHQSQGLSGRWLTEPQSTWVHSFDDYVDDFVFFATTVIPNEFQALPKYILAHSMGGLISSVAMSRHPTLFSRAALAAPMLRNKCGMKCFHYLYPFPQPIAYWITNLVCSLGMGQAHALGYFKEKPSDVLPLGVATSDSEQTTHWQLLREKYPQLLATCVTNDWVVRSIKAQKKFAQRYQFVRTNTLILAAEHDRFVYNRAMRTFVDIVPTSKMFLCPGACHELLHENETIRSAALKMVLDFFMQPSNDVSLVEQSFPFVELPKHQPIYSIFELSLRTAGLAVAATGMIAGVVLVVGGSRVIEKVRLW